MVGPRWWLERPLNAHWASSAEHTTLTLIITDVGMERVGLARLAARAQDGLVRAIRPVHTAYDGDLCFAVSLGEAAVNPIVLGEWAAEVTAAAVRDAVRSAVSLGGRQAGGEWRRQREGKWKKGHRN